MKNNFRNEEEIIKLPERKIKAIVKQCRDIPGKELFQYYEGKERHAVESGKVNEYIRRISGSNAL